MMKNKHDQGFSLVEILVAIVILVAFVVPICSALVLSAKMNTKTDDMMRAQLAVSSAVETLMAEGIPSGTVYTSDYGSWVEQVQDESAKTPEEQAQDESADTPEEKDKEVVRDRFPDVTVEVTPVQGKPWFSVRVTSNDGAVTVETSVKSVTQSVNQGG